MQHLIDEHVISLGIDPRIAPIAITDASFADHVSRQISPRAKASEMEHAIRSHIKKKLDEDPVYYQKLSERLEEILEKFDKDWEQLVVALQDVIDKATRGREQDDRTGLDPQIHAPFFDLLEQEREKEAPLSGSDVKWLADLTVRMVDELIRRAIHVVGFWKSATRQKELHGQLFAFLDENEVVEFDRAEAVADRLMELAKANQHKLTRLP